MTDKDYLKPNGTCYRINNVKADPDFMPCGNANLLGTHFACCNHGDKCLSSNACFHAKSKSYTLVDLVILIHILTESS